MSKRTPAAARSDPRRPEAVTKFVMPVVPDDEADPDLLGFLGLALGVTALLFRHKAIAWGALLASVVSYVNGRSTEADSRQGASSISFTLMGVVLMYVQLFTVPIMPKAAPEAATSL